MDKEQLEYLSVTEGTPDKINMKMFILASKLIKENKYPWGTSTRIYIDKPGKPDQKRPITFPPFMDKIIQNAILEILQAIYEAVFEKRNVSFAFRKFKSTRDNIFLITQNENAGCFMALEGDIKGAYDYTKRKTLIKNLSKRIRDQKFLKFIEKRLEYEYKVISEKEYKIDKEGLPQGGVDSPYLWNIYMLEFDDFIIENTTNLFNKLNNKKRKNLRNKNIIIKTKEKQNNDRKLYVINNIIKWINKTNQNLIIDKLKEMYNTANIKQIKIIPGLKVGLRTIIKEICNIEKENITLKEIKKNLFEEKERLKDISFNLETADKNKLKLKFAYTRYADDWILITNAKTQIIQNIKENCSKFLREELSATLEPDKTKITNMKKEPAKFLGYEIKVYKKTKAIITKNKIKTRIGNRIFIELDKQRLIDRLHMRGYCNEHGFPREIPKLTMLEFYAIIERYNSVIRGIVNAFKYSIKNPNTQLGRWIYIIRYSCLKTLAQKFKTSIRKLFKKYRSKTGKTIETTVATKINNRIYEKTWRLLTLKDAICST